MNIPTTFLSSTAFIPSIQPARPQAAPPPRWGRWHKTRSDASQGQKRLGNGPCGADPGRESLASHDGAVQYSPHPDMNLTERIVEQIKINESGHSRIGVTIVAHPYTVCGVTYSLLRCERQSELVARLSRAKHEGLEVYPRSDGLHVSIASGQFVAPPNPEPAELSDEQFARMICG